MDLVEDLVRTVVRELHGSEKVKFGDTEIDFSGPWQRRGMIDLIKEHTGVDFLPLDKDQAHKAAAKLGVEVLPVLSWGYVVLEVFEARVEEKLINPTHVIDHPLDVSPLAKVHRNNPKLVERFETFINGWEIANAFTELNDPRVQLARFEDQVAAREAGDEEAQMLDEDYVTALEYGMPPTGGWGIGIDRLTMLLTNSHNIRDVINFPTLRPKKD
jgi:lysyl-tRNA synthetase, class II